MSPTVLSVAYPFAPVGEDAVGGSEQILSTLDRAIVGRGGRSLVVAPAGSQTCGRLIAGPPVPEMLDHQIRDSTYVVIRNLLRQVLATESVDLVHLHGIDFWKYLPEAGPPCLVTLHLPLDWYPAESLRPERPRTYLHCVSEPQQGAAGGFLPVIPNGVDTRRLHPVVRKRSYALCLGRICEEKGFHHALDAARQAGVALLIAGEVFPYEAHRRYFDEQIQPRLDRCRRFLGPVGFLRKRRLLSGALCLLIPSTAAETSSLVAMEALACGTPVVAFRAGALPSIVEDGVTGFVVESAEEMARAIRACAAHDPKTCREAAVSRFSDQRMVEQYWRRYRELIAGSPRVQPAEL